MNTTLLSADKDPMGTAIADYYKRHKAERLRVFSSQFDEDEIPVKELFRMEKQMPLLERTALQLATGKILDVGAGSGCHSLALQEAGKDVHAIDISPLSVEVMQQRGVRHATLLNLFDEHSVHTNCINVTFDRLVCLRTNTRDNLMTTHQLDVLKIVHVSCVRVNIVNSGITDFLNQIRNSSIINVCKASCNFDMFHK